MTKLIKPHHPHPPHPPPENPMSNSNSGAGPVSFPSTPSDPSIANHSEYNGLSADDSNCEKSKKHLGLFTTVKRASSSAHLRLRSISTFTRSRSHGKGKIHSSESSESYSSSHSSESSEVSDTELSLNPPHSHSHIFSDPPGAIPKDLEPRRRRVSLPAFNRLRLLRPKSSRTSVKSSTDAVPVTDSTIGYTTDELEPLTARPGSLVFEAPARYQSLDHTSHNLSSESPSRPVAESPSLPDVIMGSSPSPPSTPPGLDVSISSSSSTVPFVDPVPVQKPDELLDEDILTPTLPSAPILPIATLSQTTSSILDPIDTDSDYEDSEDEDNSDLNLLEGRFISSVFIRVPVWSVRNPIGFGLIWWLLPGKRLF